MNTPAYRSSALVISLLYAAAAPAEDLSFDGIQAGATTSHVLFAADWAEYLGGSATFAGANAGGRLYWRSDSSAGDGQYMHFDLTSLSGLTVVSPAYVTLQRSNATWGGGVDGSYVATANSAWTAGGGQTVPGATAVVDALNATGSYGANGSSVSWGIGSAPFQALVGAPGYQGLAVIGGSGSTLHFDNSMAPYLSVRTGTLSGGNVAGVITVTGGGAWNGANYSFVAGDAYSAAASLRITGAVAGGTSGAGAVSINGGNVLVNQTGGVDNAYWAVDATTINAGGLLTINGHSHIHNLTLAGGELAASGVNGTWGGWLLDDDVAVNGSVASLISAPRTAIANASNVSRVFTVAGSATLNVTGTFEDANTTTNNGLTKVGSGLMVLAGQNTYTGETTVQEGVLELSGSTGGNGRVRGAVRVNPGATLRSTGGDGTGFGFNAGQRINGLVIDHGTVEAVGGVHLWLTSVTMTAGTITGGPYQWGGVALKTLASPDTATLSGTIDLRPDHGDLTFEVEDGVASTDLLVSGSMVNTAGWGNASVVKTGPGTMEVTAPNANKGNVTISGGTFRIAAGASLYNGGYNNTAVLTVNNGGTLELDRWGYGPGGDNMSLGGLDYNPARFVIDGGTVRYTGGAAGAPTNPAESPYGPGFTIGAAGATLDAAKSGDTWTVKYDSRGVAPVASNAGGTLTLTGVGDGVFDKELDGSGGMNKTGSGTWTLARNTTHTGTTSVSEGLLLANAVHSGGLIVVSGAGTLGGNGTVADLEITSGGALAPGNSAGHLTVNSLTLHPDSVLNFELGAPTLVQDPGSDFLTMNDYLILDGTINITALPGFGSPVLGDAWLLMTVAGGINNNGLAIGSAPALAGGLTFAVDVSNNTDVFLTVVPEAGAAGLFVLGASLLRLRKLLRRKP